METLSAVIKEEVRKVMYNYEIIVNFCFISARKTQ